MGKNKKEKFNIKKYIPNALSISRIPLTILFPILYTAGFVPLSITLFAIACITDMFDGKLARRWKVESEFGRVADTIGDKVLIASVLILGILNLSLSTFGNIGMSLLLAGEIAIASVSTFSKFIKKRKVHTAMIGKVKTAALMTNLVTLFFASYANLNILSNIASLLSFPIFATQVATFIQYLKIALEKENEITSIEDDNSDIKNEDIQDNILESKNKKLSLEKEDLNNQQIKILKDIRNSLNKVENDKQNFDEKSKKIGQKILKHDKNNGNK